MSSADFVRAFPDGYFLDAANLKGLERYARQQEFIGPTQLLHSAQRAGEGNMNLTLRLETAENSLILKQARPWVEKYPHIEAPADRSLVEVAFYEMAAKRPALCDVMPLLLGSDPASRVVALEDLGEAKDFTPLYSGKTLTCAELDSLVAYLEALHTAWESPLPPVFANREMRALNHEHIFQLPLASDNGLELDSFTTGLQEASEALIADRDYVDAVTKLGEMYLADGSPLVIVHGDYFPGSWLRTTRGIRIIDPEFCFTGPAAYDVGVMLGHLYLADQACAEDVLELYPSNDAFAALARQFAGVEIMRRLLGVAQLPLSCAIERKRELLELSRELVLSA